MLLKVKKVGENSGFCREYFEIIEKDGKHIEKRKRQVLARQEDFKDVFLWYTTTLLGEPDCPVRADIEIQIVD